MEMLDTVLFVLSLSLKIFTLYFAAVAVFALRRRKRFPRSAPQTRFAVVVAARNEEAVIGNLVCSVLSQEYPEALRDPRGGGRRRRGGDHPLPGPGFQQGGRPAPGLCPAPAQGLRRVFGL